MMYLGKDAVAIAKETGARFVKGAFTVPDSGSAYTLDFGKTFAKYLFVIEANNDSKTTMVNNTSIASAKEFQIIGIFPNPIINNTPQTSNKLVSRYTPSTGVAIGGGSSNHTCYESSINFSLGSFESGNQNYLYYGFTYNYYIVEIK